MYIEKVMHPADFDKRLNFIALLDSFMTTKTAEAALALVNILSAGTERREGL